LWKCKNGGKSEAYKFNASKQIIVIFPPFGLPQSSALFPVRLVLFNYCYHDHGFFLFDSYLSCVSTDLFLSGETSSYHIHKLEDTNLRSQIDHYLSTSSEGVLQTIQLGIIGGVYQGLGE
jgi:hypothetical protein